MVCPATQYCCSYPTVITAITLRFEVLTAVLLKIQVIWNVAPCCWAKSSLHFEPSQHTHFQSFFLACLTLKMKELQSFHTLVMICPTMQHQTFHFTVFIFNASFRIRSKITCTDCPDFVFTFSIIAIKLLCQPIANMLSSLAIWKINSLSG